MAMLVRRVSALTWFVCISSPRWSSYPCFAYPICLAPSGIEFLTDISDEFFLASLSSYGTQGFFKFLEIYLCCSAGDLGIQSAECELHHSEGSVWIIVSSCKSTTNIWAGITHAWVTPMSLVAQIPSIGFELQKNAIPIFFPGNSPTTSTILSPSLLVRALPIIFCIKPCLHPCKQ